MKSIYIKNSKTDLSSIHSAGGSQLGTSAFFSIFQDCKIVSVVLSNSFRTDQTTFKLSRDNILRYP